MIRRFKSQSKGIQLEFKDGVLDMVRLLDKKSDIIDWEALRQMIPLEVDNLSQTFWKECKVNRVDQKLHIFSDCYKTWTKFSTGEQLMYRYTKAEIGLIKTVEVTREFAEYFFKTEFWTKNKTLSNYVRHFNEIKLAASTGESNAGQKQSKRSSTLAAELQRRYGTQNPEK